MSNDNYPEGIERFDPPWLGDDDIGRKLTQKEQDIFKVSKKYHLLSKYKKILLLETISKWVEKQREDVHSDE